MESNWRWWSFELAWNNLPLDMAAWTVMSSGFTLWWARQPIAGAAQMWWITTDSSGQTVSITDGGVYPATGFPYGVTVAPDH